MKSKVDCTSYKLNKKGKCQFEGWKEVMTIKPSVKGKTLDSKDQNHVADQRLSFKQWFAGGAQSRGLRKPGCGHCYLRFFALNTRLYLTIAVVTLALLPVGE